MFKQVEHVLNNPNDVPDIPRVVKEHLQAKFSGEYFYQAYYDSLRAEGHSESYIAGVQRGLYEASVVIDNLEAIKQMNREEA